MTDSSEEAVQVDFTLALRGGQIGIQSVVPAGQTNLTQLLPVLRSIDNLIGDTAGKLLNEEGKTISCSAGCAACCRQMIPVSIFEAEALAAWIVSLEPAHQEHLRRRFHFVLESLSKSGMIDRLVNEDWLGNTQATQEMAIEYFQQGLACPFLEDERCSIYPIRPLACHEYFVTSPAEFCSDPTSHRIEGVDLALRPSRALYRMGLEIDGGSRGWLPLVFLLAWTKGGFTPGEAFSGTGPEVLYEFLKRVATPDESLEKPAEA